MCCLRRPTMRAAGLVGIAGGWAALVCGDPIWRVFLRLLLSDGLSRFLDQRWNLNFNFNFVWWFRRQEDYVSSKEKQQVVWPFLGTLYFWVQWIHCARSSSQRSIIPTRFLMIPSTPLGVSSIVTLPLKNWVSYEVAANFNCIWESEEIAQSLDEMYSRLPAFPLSLSVKISSHGLKFLL